VSELESFLDVVRTDVRSAEIALHQGDPEPRIAMWSTNEPVTLFGADYTAVGVEEAHQVFRRLAGMFQEFRGYDVELIAAGTSGDLAYTVSIERPVMTFRGVSGEMPLRVTQIYRPEDGNWRLVHRHGDRLVEPS
jgi:ketosteroid isomerase-like protein